MRVGIIGGGSIARLLLEHIRRGDLGRARVVAIAGRGEHSRGKQLAKAFRVPYVTGLKALLAAKPDVVVEAAAHDAVREYGEPLLKKGIALVVLSCGALCDDALRRKLERAAAKSGALLSVPSGGIGGLDAVIHRRRHVIVHARPVSVAHGRNRRMPATVRMVRDRVAVAGFRGADGPVELVIPLVQVDLPAAPRTDVG